MLRRLALRYDGLLVSHPLATKGLTTASISAIGDVTTQIMFSEDGTWDMRRTFNFSFLGLCLVTPCLHNWYGFLAVRFPGQSVAATIKRTTADQFVFAPAFLATFVTSLALMEGMPQSILTKEHMQNWQEVVVANWGLWIPAQTLNFAFVPVRYQVLFSNAVTFVWTVYLSYKSHEGNAAKEIHSNRDESIPE